MCQKNFLLKKHNTTKQPQLHCDWIKWKQMVSKSYLTLNYDCSNKKEKFLMYQLAHFKKNFHPATGQEQFFEAGLNVCQVLLPISDQTTIACTPDSEIKLHQISEFAREAVGIHINHKFKFGIKSSCWHLYYWYVLIDKIEPADPFGSMQQEAWHPWEGQAPC